MNIISNILNYFLSHIFYFTGDWGIAIMLLTFAVKALLMPLSIKQKFSMLAQQKVAGRIEELKKKYKNNKAKLEEETQKCYQESSRGMFGCLVGFLQLPVIYALYTVVSGMPAQASTILIPWLQSIKLADSHFIIPMVYTTSALSINILNLIPALKIDMQVRISKANIIFTGLFSIMLTVKTPAALGLYFITSSVFSFAEELIFRLYSKRKALTA